MYSCHAQSNELTSISFHSPHPQLHHRCTQSHKSAPFLAIKRRLSSGRVKMHAVVEMESLSTHYISRIKVSTYTTFTEIIPCLDFVWLSLCVSAVFLGATAQEYSWLYGNHAARGHQRRHIWAINNFVRTSLVMAVKFARNTKSKSIEGVGRYTYNKCPSYNIVAGLMKCRSMCLTRMIRWC